MYVCFFLSPPTTAHSVFLKVFSKNNKKCVNESRVKETALLIYKYWFIEAFNETAEAWVCLLIMVKYYLVNV